MIYILFGILLLVHMAYFAVVCQPMYTPSPDPASPTTLAMSLTVVTAGSWLVFAAWQWLSGHWWRSVFMIGTLYVVFQIAAASHLIPR